MEPEYQRKFPENLFNGYPPEREDIRFYYLILPFIFAVTRFFINFAENYHPIHS